MPQNTINQTKLKDIFSNGNLVLATLSAHPLYITARNQYCYRMNCTFESGRRKMVQTKYYDTEAEAEAMYPVYKKQVEEKTNGAIDVQIYSGGQLGTDEDVEKIFPLSF